MTPAKIQTLRRRLEETTAQFGARFKRTGRAVENWEQGRRKPDPLALSMLKELALANGKKPA